MSQNNKTGFDELAVGDSARVERILTRDALDRFASIIGPDPGPGEGGGAAPPPSRSQPGGALGAWIGALISATFALLLPDAEMGCRVQTLRFHEPAQLGDAIAATVTVTEKISDGRRVLLDCIATNQRGQTVASGSTEATVPPA